MVLPLGLTGGFTAGVEVGLDGGGVTGTETVTVLMTVGFCVGFGGVVLSGPGVGVETLVPAVVVELESVVEVASLPQPTNTGAAATLAATVQNNLRRVFIFSL